MPSHELGSQHLANALMKSFRMMLKVQSLSDIVTIDILAYSDTVYSDIPVTATVLTIPNWPF